MHSLSDCLLIMTFDPSARSHLCASDVFQHSTCNLATSSTIATGYVEDLETWWAHQVTKAGLLLVSFAVSLW